MEDWRLIWCFRHPSNGRLGQWKIAILHWMEKSIDLINRTNKQTVYQSLICFFHNCHCWSPLSDIASVEYIDIQMCLFHTDRIHWWHSISSSSCQRWRRQRRRRKCLLILIIISLGERERQRTNRIYFIIPTCVELKYRQAIDTCMETKSKPLRVHFISR